MELFEAASNLDHNIISFDLTGDSVAAYEIKLALDVYDRNNNLKLLYLVGNGLVQDVTFPWLEGDGSVLKDIVTLHVEVLF